MFFEIYFFARYILLLLFYFYNYFIKFLSLILRNDFVNNLIIYIIIIIFLFNYRKLSKFILYFRILIYIIFKN